MAALTLMYLSSQPPSEVGQGYHPQFMHGEQRQKGFAQGGSAGNSSQLS